jgi:hypothetical protein
VDRIELVGSIASFLPGTRTNCILRDRELAIRIRATEQVCNVGAINCLEDMTNNLLLPCYLVLSNNAFSSFVMEFPNESKYSDSVESTDS